MMMRRIRALSLDIVAGGVAGAAFAAHVTGARMPRAFWEVLPVAIWVVYTLDHLIDGRRAGRGASNERHAFHARHAGALALVVVLAGSFAVVRAYGFLPHPLRVAGTALAALVVLHLGAVQRRFPPWLPREVAVALLYVAGIWIGPLMLAERLGRWTWFAAALHATAALAYLFAYAWFETAMDTADGSPSLARTWGRPRLERLLNVWTIALPGAALFAAIAAGPDLRPAFLALAAVGVVPGTMPRLASHLEPFDRYRNAEWLLLLLLIPPLLARLA